MYISLDTGSIHLFLKLFHDLKDIYEMFNSLASDPRGIDGQFELDCGGVLPHKANDPPPGVAPAGEHNAYHGYRYAGHLLLLVSSCSFNSADALTHHHLLLLSWLGTMDYFVRHETNGYIFLTPQRKTTMRRSSEFLLLLG